MAQNRFNAAIRRGIWILAACGAAAGVAGCGEGDAANDAVQRAAREIQTLSLGGVAPASSLEARVATYRKILADLQPHASAPAPATAAAANMVIARAHAGLAMAQVDEVARAEARGLEVVNSVWLHFDRYKTQQAQAASLAAYDAAPHLADLDRQMKDKDAEVAQVWAEKAELERTLADLEAKATAEIALAGEQRRLETALRQRAINATAVEQADMIRRASDHKRTADAHDKQASILRAQAAQRAPEMGTLQAEIDRLTDQRRLLDDAKLEIQAFAKGNADRAAACRAEAMAAAETIRQHVAELAKVRAEIPPLSTQAEEAFDRAIRAARSAEAGGGDARALAVVTGAVNKHAKADLLAMRVRGLKLHAELMSSLAEATPPLPESAEYRSRAKSAGDEAAKLTAEAKELYTEAQSTYANAGGRGEARDRFARLAASMSSLTGQTVDAPPPEDGGYVPPTETASGDPESEVRELLSQLAAAGESGTAADAMRFFEIDDPGLRSFFEALVALDQACMDAFGQPMSALSDRIASGMGAQGGAMGDMGGGGGLDMLGVPSGDAMDFDLVVNSPDDVTIIPRAGGEEASLRATKVGGVWKLRLEVPAEQAAMMGPLATVFQRLAGDVRSGAIGTPEQIGPAMMQYIMPIMMEQMQRQMQGGG